MNQNITVRGSVGTGIGAVFACEETFGECYQEYAALMQVSTNWRAERLS